MDANKMAALWQKRLCQVEGYYRDPMEEFLPRFPVFPTTRGSARKVAAKRKATCEEPCVQPCIKKRKNNMRGWRVTVLSSSGGQLRPATPLPPRKPAGKRTAEASPPLPKRLKKAGDQHVSVARRQVTGDRKTNPKGLEMPIAPRQPPLKRRVSPSPQPRLLKKAKKRGDEGHSHAKESKQVVKVQERQSSPAPSKEPRPNKIPFVLNKLPKHAPNNNGPENAAIKKKDPTRATNKQCLEQAPKSNSVEERVRRYLTRLGLRLLKEKTIAKMIALAGSQGLGAGSYGSCCKGVDPKSGKEVVVKTFVKNALHSLVTETKCLQRLQGHGMQRLVGVCVETRQLVTRFAGHTAADYFHSGSVPFTHALSVIEQVARAVRSVNEAGYTHNDIKNNNVCVKQQSRSGGPKATLIDLGLAEPVGTRGFYKSADKDVAAKQRKFPWIAPELLRDSHPCSAASDVFSVAWFILRVPGWQDRPVSAPSMWLFKEWVRKARQPLPEQRPSLDALIQIIKQLLHTELLPCRSASQAAGLCHAKVGMNHAPY